MLTVNDLITDPRNANIGSPAGDEALDHSLETYGLVRPVCVDKDGVLVAGNRTHLAAGRAGLKKVILVESDGDALIVHLRKDFDFDSPDPIVRAKTRGASLADNQVAMVSQNIDMAIVREHLVECSIIPSTCGYSEAEIIVSADTVDSPGEPNPSEPREADLGNIQSVQRLRQVVVPCQDEAEQQKVYEMLVDLGLNPELRTL